jgi:rhodanese-related sulfurtransferase
MSLGGSVSGTSGYRDLTPRDVASERGRARFVDVREPHEYVGELGHIAGAELVPVAQVEGACPAWNKDQRIVVICRSGARSGRMAALLVSLGFKDVINLAGGMMAWNAAGLPVER